MRHALLSVVLVSLAGCANQSAPLCSTELGTATAPILLDATITCAAPGGLQGIAARSPSSGRVSIAQSGAQALVTVGDDAALAVSPGAFSDSLPTRDGGLLLGQEAQAGVLYLPSGDPHHAEIVEPPGGPPWILRDATTTPDGAVLTVHDFISFSPRFSTRRPGGGWSSVALDDTDVDGGPTAIALDDAGAPTVVYWKRKADSTPGIFTAQPPGAPVLLYDQPGDSTGPLTAVMTPGGGAPTFAFTLPDGPSLIAPGATRLRLDPLTTTSTCPAMCFGPINCHESGSGWLPSAHAIAATSDGTVWWAVFNVQISRDEQLTEQQFGHGPPMCSPPSVVADQSAATLELRSPGGGTTTGELRFSLPLATADVGDLHLAATGSALHVAFAAGSSVRYLVLETAGL